MGINVTPNFSGVSGRHTTTGKKEMLENNAASVLAQRRRRGANTEPALGQRILFRHRGDLCTCRKHGYRENRGAS